MKNNRWIQTDDYQFIREFEEGMFETINIMEHPNKGYLTLYDEVHLKDYSYEELDKMCNFYGYKNYDDLKMEYGKDTPQIMAEIISEIGFLESYLGNPETKEEVNNWLQDISTELFVA